MSNKCKPKTSFSEELFPSFTIHNTTNSNPGTPCEVFRNNTTAVEVIIKEVPKHKKKVPEEPNLQTITIKRLENDVNKLTCELKQADSTLQKSRKTFKAVLYEIKKQLDTANDRELDTRTKNLALQMENEKLKCLLDSKTNLVEKLKRELSNMKRVIKFVIKGMCYAPEIPDNVTNNSDLEYDEFENDLKKDMKVKFATKLFDGTGTFDTTATKEVRNSFDN